MISASVTLLEAFRWWSESDLPWEWFVAQNLTPREPTQAMRAGSALHTALETAPEGEFLTLSADGFTFVFEDSLECSLPVARHAEIPCQKKYGELTVRGRVDRIDGTLIRDYKFRVGSLDADKAEDLMGSYQWRFYLDMMQADVFEYVVFEASETSDPSAYVIRNVATLRQMRYPDMATDCLRLAFKYEDAARLQPLMVKYTPDVKPVLPDFDLPELIP